MFSFAMILTLYQVYKGVKTAGDKVKDTKMWDEVTAWLENRR